MFHGASDDWGFVSSLDTDERKVKVVTLQFRPLHGCGQINFQAMRSVRLRWNLKGLLAVVDFRLLGVYLLAVQENMDDLLDIADWCVHKWDCTLVCGHAIEA